MKFSIAVLLATTAIGAGAPLHHVELHQLELNSGDHIALYSTLPTSKSPTTQFEEATKLLTVRFEEPTSQSPVQSHLEVSTRQKETTTQPPEEEMQPPVQSHMEIPTRQKVGITTQAPEEETPKTVSSIAVVVTCVVLMVVIILVAIFVRRLCVNAVRRICCCRVDEEEV